jgi:hypothetical protein
MMNKTDFFSPMDRKTQRIVLLDIIGNTMI